MVKICTKAMCIYLNNPIIVFFRCLIKDFEKRPSVTHLLEHPFIRQAHGKDMALQKQLSNLIQAQQQLGSVAKTRYYLIPQISCGRIQGLLTIMHAYIINKCIKWLSFCPTWVLWMICMQSLYEWSCIVICTIKRGLSWLKWHGEKHFSKLEDGPPLRG